MDKRQDSNASSAVSPACLFAMTQKKQDGDVDGAKTGKNAPVLSVVVPMYNEAGGAEILVREIAKALELLPFEVIIVDDGSSDNTAQILDRLRADIGQLRILVHKENAGQSRAIRTGILAAKAPIIATLDGDGQNDPANIPALFEALSRSDAPTKLQMVAGERRNRQDVSSKKMASRLANKIRSTALKDGASDTGCGLKVFFREAYLRLPYFDHMHRYLPALMRREGFEVDFLGVNHRARAHGASKYTNLGRLAVSFRDMMGVMWLNKRARSPIDISEL